MPIRLLRLWNKKKRFKSIVSAFNLIGVADNFIFLDKGTSFNGTITAGEVIIEGAVDGEVYASDSLLIRKGAKVNGRIETRKLLFEEGGQHNGFVRLGDKKSLQKPKSKPFSTTKQLEGERESDEKTDSKSEVKSQKDTAQKLW